MDELISGIIQKAPHSIPAFIVLLLLVIGLLGWALWRKTDSAKKIKTITGSIDVSLKNIKDAQNLAKTDLDTHKENQNEYFERKFKIIESGLKENLEHIRENRELLQTVCQESGMNQKSIDDLLRNTDDVINKTVDLAKTLERVATLLEVIVGRKTI